MYTTEYFIEKFSLIPEKDWTTTFYCHGRKRDALGHCGLEDNRRGGVASWTQEAVALSYILLDVHPKGRADNVVWQVNDGIFEEYDSIESPKIRILTALLSAKELNHEEKED